MPYTPLMSRSATTETCWRTAHSNRNRLSGGFLLFVDLLLVLIAKLDLPGFDRDLDDFARELSVAPSSHRSSLLSHQSIDDFLYWVPGFL